MIVIGIVCLIGFYCWEKWGAPVPFLPFSYLKDRTIIGSCLLYGIMFISIFCWDAYYTSVSRITSQSHIPSIR